MSGSERKLFILILIQKNWKPVTFIFLILISFLSLYPFPKLPEIQGNDKSYHLFAYFLLALPTALKKPEKWVFYILIFVILGGILEILQPYVNRFGEWLDFLANTLGVTFGLITGLILKNFILTQEQDFIPNNTSTKDT